MALCDFLVSSMSTPSRDDDAVWHIVGKGWDHEPQLSYHQKRTGMIPWRCCTMLHESSLYVPCKCTVMCIYIYYDYIIHIYIYIRTQPHVVHASSQSPKAASISNRLLQTVHCCNQGTARDKTPDLQIHAALDVFWMFNFPMSHQLTSSLFRSSRNGLFEIAIVCPWAYISAFGKLFRLAFCLETVLALSDVDFPWLQVRNTAWRLTLGMLEICQPPRQHFGETCSTTAGWLEKISLMWVHGYALVMTNSLLLKMAIEIVSFPIKNGGSVHSFLQTFTRGYHKFDPSLTHTHIFWCSCSTGNNGGQDNPSLSVAVFCTVANEQRHPWVIVVTHP